jgi:hypothetical protein
MSAHSRISSSRLYYTHGSKGIFREEFSNASRRLSRPSVRAFCGAVSTCPLLLEGIEVNEEPRKKVGMSTDDARYLSAQIQELREALRMLYDLLENYAPPWYTEEHHNKAENALRFLKGDISEN